MHVLIVSDNRDFIGAESLRMRANGFRVDAVELGEFAYDYIIEFNYDVVICDEHLGDTTCVELVRQIRTLKLQTPVIIVANTHSGKGLSEILDMGVDAWVPAPANSELLMATIRAVVRRSKQHAHNVITFGYFTIDLSHRLLRHSGTVVKLTGKEYDLVEALALNMNRVLSKDALMTRMYSGRDEPELKIVDVFICKIRNKMAAFGDNHIETAWGRGYVMRPDPVTVSDNRTKPGTISPNLQVLRALSESEVALSQRELSIATGNSKNSIQYSVRVLCERGLLFRHDVKNGSSCYRLTESGQKVLAESLSALKETNHETVEL